MRQTFQGKKFCKSLCHRFLDFWESAKLVCSWISPRLAILTDLKTTYACQKLPRSLKRSSSSWFSLLLSIKNVSPCDQLFSNSISSSTSSELFFNYGSTTSIFWSYFLSKILKSLRTFFILVASLRTARDYVGLIRLKIPSADNKISWDKSSLPIPSGLATELILPSICISLLLRLLCR